MISATELKNGTTFLMDGNPFRVVKYTHKKIARGGGTVKLSARDLISGNLVEKTLNSSSKVDEVSTVKKPLQYLYSDGNIAYFMDKITYEQTDIPTSVLESELPFMKEGENVDVLFWDEKPLSVDVPAKVTLKVKETAPGVKGNSATNIYKSAILENNLQLKVPLFIKTGDEVRIDTKKGEYVERSRS